MTIAITVLVLGLLALIYFSTNRKRKVVQSIQPSPPPITNESVDSPPPTTDEPQTTIFDELNNDLLSVFADTKDKWLFKKNLVDLIGFGVQHHFPDFKQYPQGFVCGYIEREPNNPKDKNAIRFADVNGNTIAYVPKNQTEFVRGKLGNDFEPRGFYGRIIWNTEGKNNAIIKGFTYETLSESKKGVMKQLSEFIIDFPTVQLDYYDY